MTQRPSRANNTSLSWDETPPRGAAAAAAPPEDRRSGRATAADRDARRSRELLGESGNVEPGAQGLQPPAGVLLDGSDRTAHGLSRGRLGLVGQVPENDDLALPLRQRIQGDVEVHVVVRNRLVPAGDRQAPEQPSPA